MEPKIIAYYLPQFHPFKENNEWWGEGFTEWTNVGKAKPLFSGHYQPKVPADLGYYDLRLPLIREQQVALAKEAGVYGFCYWHYWFAPGRQLINNIIDEVRATGTPDFPFCLGWANESWKAKQWNKDGSGDKMLMEQEYGGEPDYRAHFNYVKELFKDPRYIRVDGCPFFLVYKPFNSDKVQDLMAFWNKWIKEEGIADHVYFVASMDTLNDTDKLLSMGYNAVAPANLSRMDYQMHAYNKFMRNIVFRWRKISNKPDILDYRIANKYVRMDEIDSRENVIPFIIPNWDHTPRSGRKGRVFTHATPEHFKEQAINVLEGVSKKKNQFVMLKSWNEWAEGNYMEPDLLYGKGFIKALRDAINIVYKK